MADEDNKPGSQPTTPAHVPAGSNGSPTALNLGDWVSSYGKRERRQVNYQRDLGGAPQQPAAVGAPKALFPTQGAAK